MPCVILLFLMPLLGAIFCALLPKKHADRIAVVAVSGMLLSLIGLLLVRPAGVWNVMPLHWRWLEPWLNSGVFGFLLDPLALLLLLIVVVLGFLVVLYGTAYISPGNREHAGVEGKMRHHAWLLLFIAAMIGVALSPNLLQLYFFWEMTTLCSWALISHYRNPESLRAGFKALLMTFSGGLFFALGLILLYVHTGSFDFDALSDLAPGMRLWVFLCFAVAAWAKSAQFPFFTWLPDAMAAPTTVSMFLHAAAMVKAGVFLLVRLALANPDLPGLAGLIVAVMAVVTMLLALWLFFFQDDLKKLLAYSTIAHLSYVLLGVGLAIMGSRLGGYAGAMHIMNHSVGKGLLFLCVGVLSYTTGSRKISELSGIARQQPLVALAFMAGMLAILGIPPFSGFWSKFYLLVAAIKLGSAVGWLLLVPFLLEIIVAFAWFLHVGHKVFFGPASSRATAASGLPWPMAAALIVLMLLTLIAPWVAMQLMGAMGL
ncbi:MAG TPA: hydrogenase 4 subunit D [bacterium]|nr:hydrogenase 4 subunit D [bacterium]HQG45236.1 hydrogenase 4 subunit D [bacterium]HQI49740.1 hydrogenase 4 subunit D [bacterium]HQJ65868.1 hydrogenase 4 subunit D [bacterium]